MFLSECKKQTVAIQIAGIKFAGIKFAGINIAHSSKQSVHRICAVIYATLMAVLAGSFWKILAHAFRKLYEKKMYIRDYDLSLFPFSAFPAFPNSKSQF